MRRKGLTIIWPQYFDINRPIRLGRRVQKELATNNPTTQDLFFAAQKAGYQVEIDMNVKYPRTWYDEHPGRILLDSMGQKKTFIIHKLALEVQKAKQSREEQIKLQESKKKDQKHQKKLEALKEKLKARKKN